MLKVTLVSVHPSHSPQSIPLAAAFLASYTGKSTAQIALVDFFSGDDVSSCATQLVSTVPDLIGFSLYVWNRDFCCAVAAEVRRDHPGIKLLCGGPEVTADPETIRALDCFDYVVTGEGEVPFSALCKALSSGETDPEIPGVLLPGSLLQTPPTPLVSLDNIPSPYLTGVIHTRSFPGILWQLSRGCSFSCEFCFDARGVHGVRHFSLERLEAELRHFADNGVNQVFVLDSTFNIDKERAKTILKMIRRLAPDIHFHFEVRSEFIDREMARLFAGIPCSIQIGLQSSHEEALKLVGRSFNRKDFTQKTGMLNESGAVFGFDLMYGLPGDSISDFRNSLDYALSLYPNHLDIFPLAVLPGTRLAARGRDLKLRWNAQPPYILESSGLFPASDMTEAARLAAACDIFYTRGTAVAWFNSICAVLTVKPSELLQRFSHWLTDHRGDRLNESDCSDADIREMQLHFLEQLFNGNRVRRYLSLVLDVVQYHQQYAAVLRAPASDDLATSPSDKRQGAVFKLAPSVQLLRFTYEIDDILACGEPRIQWMCGNLPPSGSQAVMYRHNGIVCTESLDPAYMHLLEQIRDGHYRNGTSGNRLSRQESDEFIAFARAEGIILTIE